MPNNLLCLLLFLGASIHVLPAQSLRTESITIADGLSQGMIYDIEQTDDGFLWFATKDGLNRFDGYNFEVFTNDPFNAFSIAGNETHRLFEDSRGNLWVSVAGKGLDVLEKNSGRFLHLPLKTLLGANDAPPSISESSDGTIWVGTIDDGLLHLRWTSPPEGVMTGSGAELLSYMEEIDRKELQGGVFFFNSLLLSDGAILSTSLDQHKVYRYTPHNDRFTLLVATTLPNNDGTCLLETKPGRSWITIGGQIYVIENGDNPQAIRLNTLPDDYYLSRIFPDGRGNMIWVANSDTKGSLFFTASEEEIIRNGGCETPRLLFQHQLFSPSSFVDRSGNLWVGTSGYGLRKVTLNRLPFQHFMQGTSVRHIMMGEKMYISRGNNQLVWYDEASNLSHIERINRPKNVFVQNVYQAKNGKSYLIYSDEKSVSFLGTRNRADYVWQKIKSSSLNATILEDTHGRIWIGGIGGLTCLLPPDDRIAYLDFSKKLSTDAGVYALHEDDQQNLWIGTTGGMIRIPTSDLRFIMDADSLLKIEYPISQTFQTNPSNLRSLRYNFVTSFCPDPQQPKRYLWVSTKGGGLNLLDKATGEFWHFTNRNSGLPNDVVYGILPDQAGRLWMSTNRGLSRLTLENRLATTTDSLPYALVFRNFRQFDGLQDDEFNTSAFAKGADGRLYFGGVNGLTVFDPLKIIDETSDAAVLITELKINNLPVGFLEKNSPLRCPIYRTGQIRLLPGQNIVTLEFALMDFANPKENRFRYRLLGIDPDWVEAGTSHSANYANLPPGTYTFEVRGGIGDGQWSAPAALEITVLPPWWATRWAYSLYALVLVTALFIFYKIRLRQKMERQEAFRLREMDEFKSRFFTNISHEFRTPLTVILGTSEQLAADSGQWVVPQAQSRVKAKLGLIRRNGESLLRLTNQILDLAKLESRSLKINYVQGDVLAYLRYISESLHSLANARNVMVRVDCNAVAIVMDYDPERLLQIVHNLLSNAIKFTPDGGKVTLFAGRKEAERGPRSGPGGFLLIKVSDTGIGIPPHDLPKIFDRFYQGDNQTNTMTGGTGIGLSLTKELVKAMGGEISAQSEAGQGTVFTVLLPISNQAAAGDQMAWHRPGLSDAADKPTDHRQSPSASKPGSHPAGGPVHHLLLIEDNPDVVEYLTACLQGSYQLDFAYNGRAGIEKALKSVPDLILSDVMMPEKDGFEVCDTLKNDERSSHIPIVLLTARADLESRIAGLRRGADAYLAKPFHQEELIVILENLLELRRKMQAKYAGLALATAIPPPSSLLPDPEDIFLQKLRAAVESRLSDSNLSADDICRMVGMSHPVIHRKVTALTGHSLMLFVRSIRLARAQELLAKLELTISDVAYEVGFNDPKFFSRVFSEEFGESPTVFRQKV